MYLLISDLFASKKEAIPTSTFEDIFNAALMPLDASVTIILDRAPVDPLSPYKIGTENIFDKILQHMQRNSKKPTVFVAFLHSKDEFDESTFLGEYISASISVGCLVQPPSFPTVISEWNISHLSVIKRLTETRNTPFNAGSIILIHRYTDVSVKERALSSVVELITNPTPNDTLLNFCKKIMSDAQNPGNLQSYNLRNIAFITCKCVIMSVSTLSRIMFDTTPAMLASVVLNGVSFPIDWDISLPHAAIIKKIFPGTHVWTFDGINPYKSLYNFTNNELQVNVAASIIFFFPSMRSWLMKNDSVIFDVGEHQQSFELTSNTQLSLGPYTKSRLIVSDKVRPRTLFEVENVSSTVDYRVTFPQRLLGYTVEAISVYSIA